MSLDVLIVDDEADIRELVSDILNDNGYIPRLAQDSVSALAAIEERVPAAVILDIWLQGSEMDGLGILEWVKNKYPIVPVIMVSGHGTIETAISSIKLGAYDYIEKPFKEDKLLLLLNRAIEAARLRYENAELRERAPVETDLIGTSPAINAVRTAITKVATTSSRVLLTGSAGCGKEVVARLIHQKSKRAHGPFLTLSASSFSPADVERELFGSEPSSGEMKVSILEKAHGGTLFIDEVGDIPLEAQGKFLRVLQTGQFERPGTNKVVNVDVRIVAGTGRDLQEEIGAGTFREDLFYRLNVVPVPVPTLQERKEDIIPLSEHLIKRCAALMGLASRRISEDAYAVMQSYSWPGNVRQLRNVIEWLLIMAPEDINAPVTATMLPPELIDNPVMIRPDVNADIMSLPLRAARELFEKQYLTAQLERFGGNVSRTAAFVGMERSAFHRKLKSLNIHNQDEIVEAV